MQIKMISVAIVLFLILLAGCASNGGEWTQDKAMVDSPATAEQQPAMESSMEKKDAKPMWDEGSKY